MAEISKLFKLKKISTTANQIDDLAEQFNHIVTNMLYKKYYGVIKTVVYNYSMFCLHVEQALNNQHDKAHYILLYGRNLVYLRISQMLKLSLNWDDIEVSDYRYVWMSTNGKSAKSRIKSAQQ